jgi:hypothetical protein
MVESQRQNVLGEFERLRRLLAEEEQKLLQKLEEEELEVLPRLRESATRLGQQSAQLAALIAELEGRCQLPALGLLQVSRWARCPCRHRVYIPTAGHTAYALRYACCAFPTAGLPQDTRLLQDMQHGPCCQTYAGSHVHTAHPGGHTTFPTATLPTAHWICHTTHPTSHNGLETNGSYMGWRMRKCKKHWAEVVQKLHVCKGLSCPSHL